ncbi:MAG TPA: hypothetical protein VFD58_10990 [Blastocatellia bacterium]|nr:hypothetical protein [Blastocatellia bacterium]
MKFARRLYLVAGVYGLLVLVPQLFTEERLGRDYPPAITHPEYFYGFVGSAVVWQVLFLILSTDPVRYRPMMVAAVLEKAVFGITAIFLFLQHRLAALVLGFGIVDLILGALFLVAYAKTRSHDG